MCHIRNNKGRCGNAYDVRSSHRFFVSATMTTSLLIWPRDMAKDYLYNLEAMNSKDAKRLWRKAIREAWNNQCAYCGATPIDSKSLTLDHVKPKCKGGEDVTKNCIPACRSCNANKGSENWIAWFRMQPFYSMETEILIKEWLRTGRIGSYHYETFYEKVS